LQAPPPSAAGGLEVGRAAPALTRAHLAACIEHYFPNGLFSIKTKQGVNPVTHPFECPL
jgi:hypothetical protein